MKAFCVQHDIIWEDKPATHARVRALLDSAEIPPGSLIVLAEMFSTGFSMNVSGIKEGPDRETERFLSDLAERSGSYVIGGIVTADGDKGRNEAVVYNPRGTEIARYCKMRPFTLGGEADCYQAGDRPALFEWQGIKVAPFICYDLRFPELFRQAVSMGAQMYAVIASWPSMRAEHWVKLLHARAIENQAYVVGVNRVGTDPKFTYLGRSMIVNPAGEILADAGDREAVVGADIDLDFLLRYRKELPFLVDMRD